VDGQVDMDVVAEVLPDLHESADGDEVCVVEEEGLDGRSPGARDECAFVEDRQVKLEIAGAVFRRGVEELEDVDDDFFGKLARHGVILVSDTR
jgi:hypothetical protein